MNYAKKPNLFSTPTTTLIGIFLKFLLFDPSTMTH